MLTRLRKHLVNFPPPCLRFLRSSHCFICIPGAVLMGKLDYLVDEMKKTFHLQFSAEAHLSSISLQSLSDCLTRLWCEY